MTLSELLLSALTLLVGTGNMVLSGIKKRLTSFDLDLQTMRKDFELFKVEIRREMQWLGDRFSQSLSHNQSKDSPQ